MNYSITTGRDTSKGIKTVIYGVEGIGKTTLAASFPDSLFIDTEGSTAHFSNVKRLPKPEDWKDIIEMIEFVSENKPCSTLVIDTFDWAEAAEVEDLIRSNKSWTSIESVGYGKGYVLSAERIQAFLKTLESKLIDKGINVVLTCHAQSKKTELPEERGAYDRYELKLGAKTGSRTSPLVKEWADMLLFCNYKTYTETDDAGKVKATGGTERVMYTTHTAVWDAKNRFGLPDELPMSFKPLAKIFAGRNGQKTPEAESVQPDPAEEKPAKAEKEQPKPEKKQPDPGADLPNVTLPDSVPEYVKEFCKDRKIFADEIQILLFQKGITKTQKFDLANVPERFWKSFTSEFDTRWAKAYEEAKAEALPF